MAEAAAEDEELFPGYPRGWFVIGVSSELEVGEVKPIKYFGREMVLYRSETGNAIVHDAFCPHLGAHLGYGGKGYQGDAFYNAPNPPDGAVFTYYLKDGLKTLEEQRQEAENEK